MYIVLQSPGSAFSQPAANILMLIITIAAALLVLFFLLQYNVSWYDPRIPCLFEITKVRHTSEAGAMIEDGYVVLKNTDSRTYENWNLYVLTSVNGNQIAAEIPTLNADELARTVNHHGVQYLEGAGSSGSRRDHDAFWYPQASLAINYSDHTIHPGDRVTIEVYDKSTGWLLSRDSFPHTRDKTGEMMDQYFNRRGA